MYELVRNAYATTTGAGASVRRVVETVATLCSEGKSPVTMLDVATRQGVHKSTASRHSHTALKGGWLVNLSVQPGQ